MKSILKSIVLGAGIAVGALLLTSDALAWRPYPYCGPVVRVRYRPPCPAPVWYYRAPVVVGCYAPVVRVRPCPPFRRIRYWGCRW